jgi:threonine aldolase
VSATTLSPDIAAVASHTDMTNPRGFASDNNAGIHPEILQAIVAANHGHVHGYGDDPYTERAVAQFKRHFGGDTAAYILFNGTGANVAALSTLVPPWGAVICAQSAHVNVDESSAPERFIGCRLVDVPTPDGKLTIDAIRANIARLGDVHHVQAGAVLITQPTELGTLYSVDEIRALCDFAHAHGLLTMMDGARVSNAAAALDLPFRAFTRDAGIDVLTFGGTKIGLMLGEAALFFKPELARNFHFIRKQAMQLESKMRFLACQFEALLAGDLWRRNAAHANAMAQRLVRALDGTPNLRLTQKVQANAVFAVIPRKHIAALQEAYFFYEWNEAIDEVRWMTSWDTTEADVDAFAALVRRTLGAKES